MHPDGRGLREDYPITNPVFNNIFSEYQRIIEIHTSELQTGRNVVIAFITLTILKLYLSPDWLFDMCVLGGVWEKEKP